MCTKIQQVSKIRSSKQLATRIAYLISNRILSIKAGKTALALAYIWNPKEDWLKNQTNLAIFAGYKKTNTRNIRQGIKTLEDLGLVISKQTGFDKCNRYHWNSDTLTKLEASAKKTSLNDKVIGQKNLLSIFNSTNLEPHLPKLVDKFKGMIERYTKIDPTETSKIDPPFTPSLQEGETEIFTANTRPAICEYILNAFLDERAHLDQFKARSVERKNASRQKFTFEPKMLSPARKHRLDKQQKQFDQIKNEKHNLEDALFNWSARRGHFTKLMHSRLLELNNGAIHGTLKIFANRFLAQQETAQH